MSSPTAPGWSTCDVGGHACDLFQPSAVAAGGRAILYLHDLDGQSPSNLPPLQTVLEQAGLPVLAPQAPGSWWLGRHFDPFDPELSAEAFLLGPVLAECHRRFAASPPGIGLLGYDMGGQAALQLAYRYPDRFPVAAAISPAIDFHLGMQHGHEWPDGERFASLWEMFTEVEEARQETALLHIHPLNWPRHQWFASGPDDFRWHDGAVRLTSKLVALGIPHTALLDRPTGNQPLEAFAAEAVAFLAEALDKEARRLT